MLHTMTVLQVLDVWVMLEDALHGVSRYGGSTTEIYIHSMMGRGIDTEIRSLDSPMFKEDTERNFDNANVAMHDLFVLFAEKRDADIEIEGKELGEWLKKARFFHRVHVKVTPK